MSFPPYDSYKSTGHEWLGVIPASWRTQKFRHLFRESSEKIEGEVFGEMLSVSGYRGIERKEYDDENRRRRDEDLVGYRVVRKGQLVVNTMWLNYAGLGFSELDGHVSPAYRAYWPKSDEHSKYLHYLLRSEHYVKGYTRLLTGVRPNSLQMSRDNMMSFPVVLPPKAEQIAISNFLDRETAKIDALIAEQERLIKLLQEKRQADISHAVTKGLNPDATMRGSGVEWLGEAPEHWKVKKLSWISNASKGKEAQTLTKEYCAINDGEYPVYSGQTSNEGVMGSLNRYEFDRPDGCLLITTVGSQKVMSIRRITGQFSLSQNCMIASPDATQVSSGYLSYALQPCFDFYRNLIPQHMQASFRMEDYYSIRILIPELDEQRQITSYLDENSRKVNAQISVCEAAVTLLKERRSALISAAVTGQIDVRGLAPDEAAA